MPQHRLYEGMEGKNQSSSIDSMVQLIKSISKTQHRD